MADRTVTARLVANVTGLVSGARLAQRSLRDVGDEAERTGQRAAVSSREAGDGITGLAAGADTAASEVQGLGRVAGQAAGGLDTLGQASDRLVRAQRAEADAAGRVRVATARLAEVRDRGDTDTARLVRAEEDLARAQRDLATAQDDTRRSAQQLARAQDDTAQAADRSRRSAADVRGAWQDVGDTMFVVGAAAGAGLVAVARAAIAWESAFAGVRKTVDGSDEEIAALEGELRQLARTLPATHAEIAATAEAAGQLGVQRDAVADFTATMIALGETTDLTAEEAATSIAQLGNVLGLTGDDTERLGAALVALGNNGASTESQILGMAQRIGGAGATLGLTADQVLGVAASLANVGIEVEAGGSAISTVMIKVAGAVASGGDALDNFAAVAGVSSREFAAAFERDPVRALDMVIQGLGRMQDSGENVFAVLEALEITEIRQRDALLRLANAQGGMSTATDLASEAWRENTALIDEAAKRYQTTEARISIAWNNIRDAAIEAGGVILPVVAGLAGAVADLAEWFGALPEPVQTAMVTIAALAAGVGILGGAFIRAVTFTGRLRESLRTITASTDAFGGRLDGVEGKVGRLVLRLGILATAVTAVDKAFSAGREEVAGYLDVLTARAGADPGAQLRALTEELKRQQAILKETTTFRIGDTFITPLTFDSAKYGKAAEAVVQLEERIAALRQEQEVAAAAHGVAAESLTRVATAADVAEGAARHVGVVMDETAQAAAEAAEEMRDAWSQASQDFVSSVGAFDAVRSRLEEQARESAEAEAQAYNEGIDAQIEAVRRGYDDRLAALKDGSRKERRALEDARDTEIDVLEDRKKGWEDFVGDVKVTFADYVKELEKQVRDQEEWQENLRSLVGRVSADYLAHLASLGPEAAGLVAAANDATAAELARGQRAWEVSGKAASDAFASTLEEESAAWEGIAAERGTKVADAVLREVRAGKTDLDAALAEIGLAIDRTSGTITVVAAADTDAFTEGVSYIDRVIAELQAADPIIGVYADTTPADRQLSYVERRLAEVAAADPVIGVYADPDPADRELSYIERRIAEVDDQDPVVGIYADPDPADDDLSYIERRMREVDGERATVEVRAATADARAGLDSVSRRLARLHGSQARVTVVYDEVLGRTVQRGRFAGRVTEFGADGGLVGQLPTTTVVGYAAGGRIGGVAGWDGASVGPYSTGGGGRITAGTGPRADDVLLVGAASGQRFLASRSEYVVNARATAQHLDLLEAINRGQLRRFADGGAVVPGPSNSTTYGDTISVAVHGSGDARATVSEALSRIRDRKHALR